MGTLPDDIVEIAGGFWIPNSSVHIPFWQNQTQRLDHDNYLPHACAKHIPVGGCVVDGGAFDGDHTIVYSRKVGPTGLVFAFEPGPLAFRCLEHNVTLFDHDNAIAVPFALGASNSHATHHAHPANDLGMSYCTEEPSGDIIVKTLDSIIKPGFPDNAHRKVDFIKLDLEGWEYAALQGSMRILTDDRPIMVLEINKPALAQHNTSFEAITTLISQFEYLHRQIDGQVCDPGLFDLVCWPSESGANPATYP